MNQATNIDQVTLTELRLYIDNDAELYRQIKEPALKNLSKKWKKDNYISERAPLLFMYLVDSGAKKYVKEHCEPKCKFNQIFSKRLRWQCALDLAKHYEEEFKLGNLYE